MITFQVQKSLDLTVHNSRAKDTNRTNVDALSFKVRRDAGLERASGFAVMRVRT